MKIKTEILLLIIIIIMSLLIISPAFFKYDYPVGGDYSPYMRYIQNLQRGGTTKFIDQEYQFGATTTMQPLIPILLCLIITITGISLINITFILFLFLPLILISIYCLSLKIFKNKIMAILSSIIFVGLPLNTEIFAWGSMANIITLFLIPMLVYMIISKKIFLSAILFVTILFSHPISTLFITLSMIIYFLILIIKKESIKNLILTGFLILIFSSPYILRLFKIFLINKNTFSNFSQNFPQVIFSTYELYFGVVIIIFSILSLLFYFSRKQKNSLILSLFLSSLILIYSHFIKISLYYPRFLWFLSFSILLVIPLFLIKFINKKYFKIGLIFFLLIFIIPYSTNKASYAADYHGDLSSLNGDLKQGLEWIKYNSPEDSIIMGDANLRWMSFLSERKNFVVFPISLVGPKEQLKTTRDLWKIINLEEDYKKIIKEYRLDYILLSKNRKRSLNNFNGFYNSKLFNKVYENKEIIIFEINH